MLGIRLGKLIKLMMGTLSLLLIGFCYILYYTFSPVDFASSIIIYEYIHTYYEEKFLTSELPEYLQFLETFSLFVIAIYLPWITYNLVRVSSDISDEEAFSKFVKTVVFFVAFFVLYAIVHKGNFLMDKKTKFSCLVYDGVKKACLEYQGTKKEKLTVENPFNRDLSFYNKFSCSAYNGKKRLELLCRKEGNKLVIEYDAAKLWFEEYIRGFKTSVWIIDACGEGPSKENPKYYVSECIRKAIHIEPVIDDRTKVI